MIKDIIEEAGKFYIKTRDYFGNSLGLSEAYDSREEAEAIKNTLEELKEEPKVVKKKVTKKK